MGLDPLSLATSATQFGMGALQSLIAGGKARKAQRELEGMPTPTYNQNKSIMDFYNKALQRYNVNPYQSQQYQNAIQMGNRSTAAGLNALQSRGSAVAGVGRLASLQNEQALKAGAMAENEQSRRFNQLEGATQLKAGEDRAAFQQNEIAPFEKKYNLLSMKAGAANQTANAGISNMFGGLSSIQQMAMLDKMYGDNSGGGSAFTQTQNPAGVGVNENNVIRNLIKNRRK